MAKRQQKEAPARAQVRPHSDIEGWGADLDPKDRPGVPFHRPPAPAGNAHWDEPEPQSPETRLARPEPARLTPVFGTAQPPQGLPGAIRRAAYRIPEHRARRWLLLIAADRVEAYGSRLVALGAAGIALWLLRPRPRTYRLTPRRAAFIRGGPARPACARGRGPPDSPRTPALRPGKAGPPLQKARGFAGRERVT